MKRVKNSVYNKKILSVDDLKLITEDIKYTLIDLGFSNLDTANSIEEALKKAKKLNPDLLIMDLKLDGVTSGYELSKKIERLTNCKSLFISGCSIIETVSKIIMEDPNALILKPINDQELEDKIYLKISGKDKWEKIYQKL